MKIIEIENRRDIIVEVIKNRRDIITMNDDLLILICEKSFDEVSIDEIDEKFSRMILFVTIDLLKNLFKSSIVVIVTCFFRLIKKS